MEKIPLLVLSIIPGLFLLWLFFHADRYEKEPAALVWKTFFRGVFVVVPVGSAAGFISAATGLTPTGIPHGTSMFAILLYAVLGIGLLEESGKLWAMQKAYRDNEFNEVMDGIVYGAAAAAGFATFENIFYVMVAGYGVGVARALLSVPCHVFWGAITGFYLGLSKFSDGPKAPIIFRGLVVATLFHGLFDFALLTRNPLLMLGVFPIAIYGYISTRKHIKTSLGMSPFRAVAAGLSEMVTLKKNPALKYRRSMALAGGWLLIVLGGFMSFCFVVSLLTEKKADEGTMTAIVLFCLAPLMGGTLIVHSARIKLNDKLIENRLRPGDIAERRSAGKKRAAPKAAPDAPVLVCEEVEATDSAPASPQAEKPARRTAPRQPGGTKKLPRYRK